MNKQELKQLIMECVRESINEGYVVNDLSENFYSGEEVINFVVLFLKHEPTYTQIPIDRVKLSLEGRITSDEMDKVLINLQRLGKIRIFGNNKYLKTLPPLYNNINENKSNATKEKS